MGCTLRGGGCCGVVLASGASETAVLLPGHMPDGLNPSTIVGCRSRDGCFVVDPFKGGADWLVVKFAGGRLEGEAEVSGDVLMGVRMGRVGVVDVEAAGTDEDGLKMFAVVFFSACTDVIDDGTPNSWPGVKAGALGSSRVAGGRSRLCPEAVIVDVGGVGPAGVLLGNPDWALCEVEKVEDEGAVIPVTGVCDVDGVIDLAKGDPKTDVGWSPMFDTTGADVNALGGEKEELAFAEFCSAEALGTEEVGPKVEEVPKAEEEEELPNAEPEPKPRFPKTLWVVLRFANAEAAGGTELGAEDASGAETGIEEPKAEADDVPKTEVDEVAPCTTEGEGRSLKLFVSHSVALGFSGLGWC